MKKIFTLLSAAAMAVPAIMAADVETKAELRYHQTPDAPFDVVATMAQKITYDANKDQYTIENFLGWEGANVTFNIPADVVSEKYGNGDRHPIDVIFPYNTYQQAFENNSIIIQNKQGGSGANVQFSINRQRDSGNFADESGAIFHYVAGTPFACNAPDADSSNGSNIRFKDKTEVTYATISNGVLNLVFGCDGGMKTIFKSTDNGTTWTQFGVYGFGSYTQVTYTLPEKCDTAGIEEIGADNSDAPVEYFNLQGIRVENPESGLYIRRQGNTVTKVIL